MEQLAKRQQGTREIQRPLRAAPRRRAAAKTSRGMVRREEKLTLAALLGSRISEIPPALYERLATGGLQSAIVATMVGVTLFFHAPLMAVVGGMFR
jgi:hypothetical protein